MDMVGVVNAMKNKLYLTVQGQGWDMVSYFNHKKLKICKKTMLCFIKFDDFL